jgi:anti-sigma factor RsiW
MSKGKLSEEERADLVAYLDGELAGEAARAMEAKISLDPRLRAEAESLKRTYDLLDFLPSPPEPSPAFTEKTLSKLEPIRKIDEADRPTGGGWHWLALALVWLVAMAGAGVGGYYGYRAWVPYVPGDEELVRDLRLIENKKHYERIDDVEFLKELADPDLFGD